MTRKELKAIGNRLFGPQWQTPLAHALGVAFRTVQRWSSGKVNVPDGVAAAVRCLDDHDAWIIGDGAETLREFIVHTKWPRFIGRMAMAHEAFDIGGLTYGCKSDVTLCEIIWIDTPPTGADELEQLFDAVDVAIEMAALDASELVHGDTSG